MIASENLLFVMLGLLTGVLFGAPRLHFGNIVFEPRMTTRLMTWPLAAVITMGLVALHWLGVLTVRWIPFFVALGCVVLVGWWFAYWAVEKGILHEEKLLRRLYVLRLDREHRYEPNVPPEFILKTLAERDELRFWPHAYLCARLSWLAYKDDAAVSQCAQEWGLEGRRVVKDNLAFVLLHDSRSIFIAFEGTNDIKDWLANVDGRKHQDAWGKVHIGFDAATESLWDDVSTLIRSTQIADPVIWLTGHSLGGALAMLTAVRLVRSDIGYPTGIFTFGQPAVGDLSFRSVFQQSLGERMFRFVSCSDEVPNQPPHYVQAGALHYFDRMGRRHVQPEFMFMFRDRMFQENRGYRGTLHGSLPSLDRIHHPLWNGPDRESRSGAVGVVAKTRGVTTRCGVRLAGLVLRGCGLVANRGLGLAAIFGR